MRKTSNKNKFNLIYQERTTRHCTDVLGAPPTEIKCVVFSDWTNTSSFTVWQYPGNVYGIAWQKKPMRSILLKLNFMSTYLTMTCLISKNSLN